MLEDLTVIDGSALVLLTIRMGTKRLIDNGPLTPAGVDAPEVLRGWMEEP